MRKHVLKLAAKAAAPRSRSTDAIKRYLTGARTPFSDGYTEYKEAELARIIADPATMQLFNSGGPLPDKFGTRLDERIVEYPWVFSHLGPHPQRILDAGSTFNKPFILELDHISKSEIIIYTLETDWITYKPNLSYLFGDLRSMLLKDNAVDTVVCISTLEHVGFTYEYQTYSRHNPWPDARPQSYLDAITEFRRVLKPGGRLLLTVPFGRYEDHGWLQQFDLPMIEHVCRQFGGAELDRTFYRYASGGWSTATPGECTDLSYFNIHETGSFEEDGLAAARAVCCLELEKTG